MDTSAVDIKSSQRIKEILIRENYLPSARLEQAEVIAAKQNISLADYLLNEGLITKDILGQAIAELFGVSYSDLSISPSSWEQVRKIPEHIAREYNLVFVQESENEVICATCNPQQQDLDVVLKEIFQGKDIQLNYAFSEDIEPLFIHYNKPLNTRFTQIINERHKVAPEIIEEIIHDAISFHASDIHFEPQQNKDVTVRFRIDGVLREAGRIPYQYYENILNRIKVQAHLRTDEHGVRMSLLLF